MRSWCAALIWWNGNLRCNSIIWGGKSFKSDGEIYSRRRGSLVWMFGTTFPHSLRHTLLSISIQLPLRESTLGHSHVYWCLQVAKFLTTHSAAHAYDTQWSTEDFTASLVRANWDAVLKHVGWADSRHPAPEQSLSWQINTNTLTLLTFCCPPGLRRTLSCTMHFVWECVFWSDGKCIMTNLQSRG